MDRLPTKAELRFMQAHRELGLKTLKAIRDLSGKVNGDFNSLKLLGFATHLQPSMGQDKSSLPYVSRFGRRSPDPLTRSCLYSEVSQIIQDFWAFVLGKSGYKRATRKVEEGIARLEWIRDNWGNLTVSGDAATGYELIECSA